MNKEQIVMFKYLPLIVTFIMISFVGYIVVTKKSEYIFMEAQKTNTIGAFVKQKTCARPPQFLTNLKIPQPVMIDLSQKRFKGIALLHGKNLEKVFHPKQWEQYGYMGTYTLDEKGNIYVAPMPYISIYPTTFNLQKNIYKVDSKTGKLSIVMHLDDVFPSASNPYGVNTLTYDCDDKTLWVAAIDESDYSSQKGVIYHIDLETKEILQKIEGFDVLSMTLLQSDKGKFLLVGSARDNGLYAYRITENKLEDKAVKLLELPHANEHIRKIKITAKNQLELQSIPFSYTLIARSAKEDRLVYKANWNSHQSSWILSTR